MASKLLGVVMQDQITKMAGTVTAVTEYITGCNQVLLQPEINPEKPHDVPEPYWFDEQRCQRIGRTKLALDNSKTPGFDREAPKK